MASCTCMAPVHPGGLPVVPPMGCQVHSTATVPTPPPAISKSLEDSLKERNELRADISTMACVLEYLCTIEHTRKGSPYSGTCLGLAKAMEIIKDRYKED